MLGKAKDVKIKEFANIKEYEEWAKDHGNYEIIDFLTHDIGIITVVYKKNEGWI